MAVNKTQSWALTLRGRHHRVDVDGSVSRSVRWYVDDALVALTKSSDDHVVLEAKPDATDALGLKFDALGRAKRVTLYEGDDDVDAQARATLGTGGIDLDPEPGSAAARREQRIREHPRRHTAIATAMGVVKVVVPLLLGLLVVRFALSLPWPSWNLPWPNIPLPRIPWPDVPRPDVPWPDIELPNWRMPDWVRWIADKAKYVWPILLAYVLARGENNRRRKQDALKADMKAAGNSDTAKDAGPNPQQGPSTDPHAQQDPPQ